MEQVTLQLPMMLGFKPMAEQFGMEFLTIPLPSWYVRLYLSRESKCIIQSQSVNQINQSNNPTIKQIQKTR